MKKIILSFTLFVALAFTGLQATPAFAVGPLLDQALIDEVSCLDKATGKPLPNCNYSLNSFVKLGIRASNIILGVVGALTLAMFIYGGVTLLVSAGNTETVSKGKNIIVGAVVGLVIVFASYTLISFLVNNIFQAKVNGQSAFSGTTPEDDGSSTLKRPVDCTSKDPAKGLGGTCVPTAECQAPKSSDNTTKQCALQKDYVCCVTPPVSPHPCEDNSYVCQEGQCNADGGFFLVEPPLKCQKDGDVCCDSGVIEPGGGEGDSSKQSGEVK